MGESRILRQGQAIPEQFGGILDSPINLNYCSNFSASNCSSNLRHIADMGQFNSGIEIELIIFKMMESELRNF